MLGGRDRLTMVEKYDVDGNMVKTLPSLTMGRRVLGCGIYQEEIYAVGGLNSEGLKTSIVEVYNIESRIWRNLLYCILTYMYTREI